MKTVQDALNHLTRFAGDTPLEEVGDVKETVQGVSGPEENTVAGTPFWKGMVCTGLKIIRPLFKLNEEESAAWDVVQGMICGG